MPVAENSQIKLAALRNKLNASIAKGKRLTSDQVRAKLDALVKIPHAKHREVIMHREKEK